MKKLKVIKVIDTALPDDPKWTREYLARNYQPTTLYSIEKRAVVEIVHRGVHVRYLMKRDEFSLKERLRLEEQRKRG